MLLEVIGRKAVPLPRAAPPADDTARGLYLPFTGRGAGWWVLGVLLALTLGRAATAPRDRWPGLVGDEPTYLMQAESLAWDGDLRFAAEDLERFRARRGHSPEVILQSGDGGARIVYGKPFFYAVAIAPLVRVLGERGATLANAIALAIAALLAARALAQEGRRVGAAVDRGGGVRLGRRSATSTGSIPTSS